MTIKLDGFLRTLKKDLLLDEMDVFLKLKNESVRKFTKSRIVRFRDNIVYGRPLIIVVEESLKKTSGFQGVPIQAVLTVFVNF